MIQNILIAGDLKDKLSAIKQGQTAWEQVNQEQLLQSMLAHIGSTDSELRDTYIYSSFYEWILEKNLLDHRCLTKLWHYCLDHLLLNGIEEEESDGVFTRSFTTLLVALILARDLAHSVAHVSDAMDELVKNPKIKKTAYDDMLHALWSIYLQPHYIFIHDEDERLLVPIFAMLERGLAQNEVVQLIQQMPATLSTLKDQLDEANFYIVRFNCKTLLKSFFIQTNHQAQYASLHQSIVTCLNEIN